MKSNLCDYNDEVKCNIFIIGNQATQVAFKNCEPFTKCTAKVDGIIIDDARDWDFFISMYNSIEYSSNYSETTGILVFVQKMKQLILIIKLETLMILKLSSTRLHYLETQLLKAL